MNQAKLKEVLEIKDLMENIQTQIDEIEQRQIIPLRTRLKSLKDKKSEVDDEIITDMQSEGIKTLEHEGATVSLVSRQSIKISDDNKVFKALSETHVDKLKKLTGISKKEDIIKSLLKTSINTTEAKKYIDMLKKVEDIDVTGVDFTPTNYLKITI